MSFSVVLGLFTYLYTRLLTSLSTFWMINGILLSIRSYFVFFLFLKKLLSTGLSTYLYTSLSIILFTFLGINKKILPCAKEVFWLFMLCSFSRNNIFNSVKNLIKAPNFSQSFIGFFSSVGEGSIFAVFEFQYGIVHIFIMEYAYLFQDFKITYGYPCYLLKEVRF